MNLEKALKILNISGASHERDLKRSYLTLVKSYHPDRFHNNETLKKEGEDKLKLINLAYDYIKHHSSEGGRLDIVLCPSKTSCTLFFH